MYQILWIIEVVDLLNRIGEEIFLVIGWQQKRERKLRLPINRRNTIHPGTLRFLPDIQTQPNAKDRLGGHQTNDRQIHILKCSDDRSMHVSFSSHSSAICLANACCTATNNMLHWWRSLLPAA